MLEFETFRTEDNKFRKLDDLKVHETRKFISRKFGSAEYFSLIYL